MLPIRFVCFLYVLTNTSQHRNLSYNSYLQWWVGCEGRGRGKGCSWQQRVCVCVCGYVNLAETWDEKTHSPVPLSPRDCTSRFSPGGVFLSSMVHLQSKGRISTEHATGFELFSQMAQFSYLLQQRLNLGFWEWTEPRDCCFNGFWNKLKHMMYTVK